MAEPAKKTMIDEIFSFGTLKAIFIVGLLGLFGYIGINFWERLLPIFGSVVLGYFAFKIWKHYVQQKFIAGITWVLLEIIPPRDVLRSPKAMELFFTNALYHQSQKGAVEMYWQGAVWFWYSLELVSIDGQVHFYIRTPSRIQDLITTQIYAQYPQAQVKVAEDYTLGVDEISKKSSWNLWGCEFALKENDPHPIKTYVDFGLDKDPKEEYKVDPISSVIELFSSLKKGEQMWSQIVIRPTKKTFHTPGTLFGKHDWVKEANLEILKLLRPYTAKYPPDTEGKSRTEIRLPDFLKLNVTGIGNKISKLGFDCGIRVAYVAKKEVFNNNNQKNLRLMWRQYTNPDSNSFERLHATQGDIYPWSIFIFPDKNLLQVKDRFLNEYRERSFFYIPLRHSIFSHNNFLSFWPISPGIFPGYLHVHTFVLNTEELATIFHFPGQILQVPTLERIESKEAAPPTNLPS